MRFCCLLISVLPYLCYSSSWNEPHAHQGKVTPFEPGDPKIKLDKKAINILNSGHPYKTQVQSGTSGRGLVVQDINAPTNIVWDRILDYDNYANMVPKTVESKNYSIEKAHGRDGSQIIYTRMKVGFPILKLEFFIKHTYKPKLNSLTWTLDYSKKSDFDDSCGFWYVIPHPDHPKTMTRVYYSVEVSMYSWVPKFVVDFMSTKALTDATEWVRKYSEIEYSKNKKNAVNNKPTNKEKKKNVVVDDDEKKEEGTPDSSGNWFQSLFFLGSRQDKKQSLSSSSSSKEEEEEVNKRRRSLKTLAPSSDNSARSSREECNNEEECPNDNNVSSIEFQPNKIGIVRVSLLASFAILVLFNIHLYFSQ